MQKIIYRVNGGKTTNIIHCSVVSETEHELTVLINDELTRVIKKSKIVEAIDIN